MEITYIEQHTPGGASAIQFKYDGMHIGTIFGKVRPLRKHETLDKEHNIITIVGDDSECPIAYIWNAHKESGVEV